MKWLHWFSLVVAVCALVVIGTGALATTVFAQALFQHSVAAHGLALLAVVQIVWTLLSPPLRGLAGLNFLLFATEMSLGFFALGSHLGLSQPAIAFYHAIVAQLFFVIGVVTFTLTAPSWRTHPVKIPDKGWPSLRGFASLTAILVFVQMILGAAFRHNLLGVLWHIIGALILALFVLGLAMLILNQPPESIPLGNPLRSPAIVLLVIAGFQLALGLTVVSISANSKHAAAVVVMVIIHTINGALTFAAATTLMLLARRHTA